MTVMQSFETALNSGVQVLSVYLTDCPTHLWTVLRGKDGWCVNNHHFGGIIAMQQWLAHMTQMLRASGIMGPTTTATINHVCVFVDNGHGDCTSLYLNSPEWTAHVTAALKFAIADERPAACAHVPTTCALTQADVKAVLQPDALVAEIQKEYLALEAELRAATAY